VLSYLPAGILGDISISTRVIWYGLRLTSVRFKSRRTCLKMRLLMCNGLRSRWPFSENCLGSKIYQLSSIRIHWMVAPKFHLFIHFKETLPSVSMCWTTHSPDRGWTFNLYF
jgi:hypothetical protein